MRSTDPVRPFTSMSGIVDVTLDILSRTGIRTKGGRTGAPSHF